MIVRVKIYIDNIFIVGEIFKYIENGLVGLMIDDYCLFMLEFVGFIYFKG